MRPPLLIGLAFPDSPAHRVSASTLSTPSP
jgi:hypothetical protein